MWHNRSSENEKEAVDAHISQHRDSKAKKHDIEKLRQLTHGIAIPRHFSEDKKPRHRDSKAEKPQHRDSKTKKPRY